MLSELFLYYETFTYYNESKTREKKCQMLSKLSIWFWKLIIHC